MKLVIFSLLLMLSFSAVAGYDDVMAVHRKYCQQKIAKACVMLSCEKDPSTCSKKIVDLKDKDDEAFALETQKLCLSDQACRKKQEAKRYQANVKACGQGNVRACYEKDYVDASK